MDGQVWTRLKYHGLVDSDSGSQFQGCRACSATQGSGKVVTCMSHGYSWPPFDGRFHSVKIWGSHIPSSLLDRRVALEGSTSCLCKAQAWQVPKYCEKTWKTWKAWNTWGTKTYVQIASLHMSIAHVHRDQPMCFFAIAKKCQKPKESAISLQVWSLVLQTTWHQTSWAPNYVSESPPKASGLRKPRPGTTTSKSLSISISN